MPLPRLPSRRSAILRAAWLVAPLAAAGILAALWLDRASRPAAGLSAAPATAAPAPALAAGSPSRDAAVRAAALRALPYVDGTFDPERDARGVLVHAPRAFDGLNFWSSRRRGEAYLMDMEGRLLHRWRHPGSAWNHVELLGNGDVLGVERDRYLVRLDSGSRLLWRRDGGFHHDLWFSEEGTIWALSRRAESRPELHPHLEVLADYVTVLDPRGAVVEEIPILDLLLSSPYAHLLRERARRPPAGAAPGAEVDVLHTNHLEVFDGSLAAKSPLFRRGNLLLSMREIDAVAIVDGARREVVWLWGPGEVVAQHQPTLLPSGTLLLFDNGAERSRVLEVDPVTRRILWTYGPGEGFFSPTRGGCQRLGNGNTLITESDRGYAFEVTPEGEVVWKYANPDVDEEGRRMVIWRMKRFLPRELPFLAALH